jgi:hypothetical protein
MRESAAHDASAGEAPRSTSPDMAAVARMAAVKRRQARS